MDIGGGKRVLMVGDEGVVLYAGSGRGIERETAISWEVPNFEDQLTDVLAAQNTAKSTLVLFDSADQAYKNEEIPGAIGALNRANFVKRKAMQLFPSHPIRAALEIKPGSRGKRRTASDNVGYLFAALPETDRLDRIGKALLQSGVPIAGFCLLPIESSSLVQELAKKVFGGKDKTSARGKTDAAARGRSDAAARGRSDTGQGSRWAAVIGQHETGARRQVFIKDGNLAFTRLTPTSEAGASGAGWVEEVTQELKGTLAFISRIGYTISDGLDLIVVCGDLEKQFFDPKALPVTNFRCLNVGEALRHIGIKSYGLDKTNYADALHAGWAAKKGVLKLPMRVPSIHRIQAPRLMARVASVALVLAALGASYFAFTDYQSYRELQAEIDERDNQRVLLDREYQAESKVFDALPVKPEVVKGALAVKKTLETNTAALAPTLHTLKTALGNDIFLDELKYSHEPADSLPLGGVKSGGGPGIFKPAPKADDRGEIKLSFRFGLPSSLELEQKVNRAEALEKSLKEAFPAYSVRIVSQFGKVKRQGKFQGDMGIGSTAQASANDDLAEFELKGPPL